MREPRQQDGLETHLTDRDGGFTLVELMIVILILGILASVVVVAASGMRTDAAGAGCDSDLRIVGTAAEAYFAHTQSDVIPATGVGDDRYEQTLVEGGYLRAVSDYYDLDADGVATPQEDAPC